MSSGAGLRASGSVEVINRLGFLFLRPGLNAVYSEHSFAFIRWRPPRPAGRIEWPDLSTYAHTSTRWRLLSTEHALVFLGNPNNHGTIYGAPNETISRAVPSMR